MQEIEEAIARLSPEEFAQVVYWIDQRRDDVWDRRMKEDAKSGKLDRLYEKLEAENIGQPSMTLDEFLDQEELS